ncbi:MAG: helix-turn-helix domain-containing protein [Thermoplasmata archaeon]|nr:helix-turn-helix domain-containing protein [Thermoplasmata archaeon]MCI4353802.1 helix-turn-helix domain-containing protein [Thermoplasmata archaeon]
MQTVTLEFRTRDLELLGVIPPKFFQRYEEVELLETLRLERGWRLQLLRIRRRGALRTAEELERESRRIRSLYGLQSFELVERRTRTRDYIVLVRQRNPEGLRRLLALSAGQITPTAPFRIDAERTVATFHATERLLRRVLDRLRREEVPFRVIRAARHPLSADVDGPGLTEKQRVAVARAWALGYYTVPRRVTLTRLAKVSGQSPPALGKMLRRAEGRLVARFLAEHSENAPPPDDAPASALAAG